MQQAEGEKNYIKRGENLVEDAENGHIHATGYLLHWRQLDKAASLDSAFSFHPLILNNFPF